VKYRLLTRLRIRHGYYASGRCTDIAITPSARGARALARHRLVLKIVPDGLQILAPLDPEGAPLIALDEGLRVRFQLRVERPGFMDITDLSAHAGTREPVYSNLTGAAENRAIELVEGPLEGELRGAFAELELGGLAASWLADPPEF
jgi:hypothetical protein